MYVSPCDVSDDDDGAGAGGLADVEEGRAMYDDAEEYRCRSVAFATKINRETINRNYIR